MITVTPKASKEILGLMNAAEGASALRIRVMSGGCSGLSYGLNFEGEAQADDQVLESNGVRLYVDAQSALYLEGASIDFIEGTDGSGFRIENPNAKSCSSGCDSCG
jgi:iron-sulfur cluster assembly protein